MKSPKIYTIQKNFEPYDNFGLKHAPKSSNTSSKKTHEMACKYTDKYYSKKYTLLSLLNDYVAPEYKIANKKICLGDIEKEIIKTKITLINNINGLILKYIVIIISFIYLFNFSVMFGPNNNTIPKLIFSLLIPLYFAKNSYYLPWVVTLGALHYIPHTRLVILWIGSLIQSLYDTVLAKVPLLVMSDYYIFRQTNIFGYTK